MPDFEATITSGSVVLDWRDPEQGANPSRTNPDPLHAHRHHVVIVGATVTIKARVGGVEGPLDTALGGALFYHKWAEWPDQNIAPPPLVSKVSGQSSVISFVPKTKGHYLLMIRRKEAAGVGGGGLGIPFDVVASL